MDTSTFISAMASSGVGSRLMITNFAPCDFASLGKSAAGVTTREDPIARIKSHDWQCSQAAVKTSSGSDCPKDTVACFIRAEPQLAQEGTRWVSWNSTTRGSAATRCAQS